MEREQGKQLVEGMTSLGNEDEGMEGIHQHLSCMQNCL
jgi:hypothetical protein